MKKIEDGIIGKVVVSKDKDGNPTLKAVYKDGTEQNLKNTALRLGIKYRLYMQELVKQEPHFAEFLKDNSEYESSISNELSDISDKLEKIIQHESNEEIKQSLKKISSELVLNPIQKLDDKADLLYFCSTTRKDN